MKVKQLILLSSVVLSLVLASQCSKTTPEKKLVGVWQLDTIYFKDGEKTIHLLYQSTRNFYQDKIVPKLTDTLKKYENAEDSAGKMKYLKAQQQYQKIKFFLENYTYEDYMKEIMSDMQSSKGVKYIFNPDGSAEFPFPPYHGSWTIRNDTLLLQANNSQLLFSSKILKLTNKKLVMEQSDQIDTIAIYIIQELTKVNSKVPKNNKTQNSQP